MHQKNECEEQGQRERMNENRRKGSRGYHSPLLTYHSFQKTFSHNFARQHTFLLPPRLLFIHQQALTEHLLWAGHRVGSRLQRWITHGLHPQGTTDLLRNGHRNEKSGKSSKRGNCQMLSDFILGYNNFFTHRCCGAGDCMWGWLVSGSPWCLGSQPGRTKPGLTSWLGAGFIWCLERKSSGSSMSHVWVRGPIKQSLAAPYCSISL